MKTPGTCVFCSSKGLTKEHIWPDWLRNYVPRRFTETTHATSLTMINFSTKERFHRKIPGRLQRSGDPLSRKLRVVCKSCNNGWMSSLQQSTKPILLDFIAGSWKELNNHEQKILASWATMFTMVVEFADINTLVTSASERDYLRTHLEPPANWQIWIGYFKGDRWYGVFNHFGFDGIPLHGVPELDEQGQFRVPAENRHRTQSTAFVVGDLFIQTFSTNNPKRNISSENFAALHGLNILWPLNQINLTIKRPNRLLNDFDADEISRAFVPIMMRPSVRHAWETE